MICFCATEQYLDMITYMYYVLLTTEYYAKISEQWPVIIFGICDGGIMELSVDRNLPSRPVSWRGT